MKLHLSSFFLIALSMLLAACSAEDPATPPDAEPLPVETTTAATASTPQIDRYSGTIEGAQRVPLSTKMMGTVTALDVEEGDRVREGQTLVRVRSQNVEAQKRQVEARLREARAARDNAETTFNRMKALREKDSATQQEFDNAQTGFERAQAQVEALESQLEEIEDMLAYATVQSPIDGFVVEKRSEAGALAAPGQPLLVVETLDEMKAVVQVPAESINRFSMGDSVTVEVGAAGNVTRQGVVSQINPAGHYASRQFEVQVQIARNGDGGTIKSGMYAQVLHQTGTRSALTVPRQALVQRGQLTGLYTVANDQALLRWVRTGAQMGDRVEVLSGLRPGEPYIVNAQQRILDGQRVRVE
jgi:RND family efflux transporter MFP subunit